MPGNLLYDSGGQNSILTDGNEGRKLMKKILALALVVLLALPLLACEKQRTGHCDACGVGLQVDSKIDESWIVFCKDCEPDVIGD